MPQKVLVGFDGSVDRTVKPIRIAGTPNQYFATIEDYGKHITSKAGLSCSLQNEVIKSQAGGNSVFVAQSLNAQGYDVYLVGLFGEKAIAPEFVPLADRGIEICSYGDSQFCECYEFDDGKIMVSPQIYDLTEPFGKVTAAMKDRVDLLREADLVALLNWGEIPWMQKLWESISSYMNVGGKEDQKIVFFDPADVSCRSADEIQQMLGCIHKASLARHCVLSVNENEAFCIARTVYKEELRLEAILERLVQDGYADEVVIHTRYKALAFDGTDFAEALTDYVDKPLFSTGAGDNFNGGYCGALLKKTALAKRLQAANYASHHFLTTGHQAGAENFD